MCVDESCSVAKRMTIISLYDSFEDSSCTIKMFIYLTDKAFYKYYSYKLVYTLARYKSKIQQYSMLVAANIKQLPTYKLNLLTVQQNS